MAGSISSTFGSSLKFPLHSITLIFIYAYLFTKTVNQAYVENNLRDEGIGGKCSCKSKDFYEAIYYLSLVLWVASVFIVFFYQLW